MPSNPLDDILREVDPIDAATLFAGLRNSVPLGMLFRSGALNENEQEQLERKWASVPRAPLPPVREPTIDEQIAQFERDFPNPVMRKVMVDEIMRMRAAQPQQPVAQPRGPRREYAQPIPTQFISPIRKAGGGGIFKKTLDEMQAELAKKGAKATKAADPDLSRRAFFGLSPKTDFPLANIPTSELEKLRNAPSITEKTTTVKPSSTAPKIEETVKKVAETPVSRRTLLKSASGQVLKGVLPETGLPGVEDIAKQVAEGAAPSGGIGMTIPASILRELGKLGEDYWSADYTKYAPQIAKELNVPEQTVKNIAANMEGVLGQEGLSIARDLFSFQPFWLRPSDVAKTAVGIDPAKSGGIGSLKPIFRSMKQADPEMFSRFKEGVKDFTMGHNESMFNPWNLPLDEAKALHQKFLRGEKSYKDVSDFFNKYIDLE